ncbi:coatomer subunit epsilon [Pelomyxa schiedti]|nr:coatomer subunit epsilon [Pelomyxa schiedti]
MSGRGSGGATAAVATTADELFETRTMYWLGAYHACINAGAKMRSQNAQDKLLRDVYVYRSYIAIRQARVVLDEVADKPSIPLQAVKMFASLVLDQTNTAALATLQQWAADPTALTDPTVQLMCGSAYYLLKDLNSALKCIHSPNSLETMALLVQTYIAINRLPLADQVLTQMQSLDDDAVITQLAGCWLHIAMGGEKCQEALGIYQELSEKYGSTVLLLNGMAAAAMSLLHFGDAEKFLLEAQEKNANDLETTINLLVCSLHLHKSPEIITRYINQLKESKHPLAEAILGADKAFETALAHHQTSSS